MKARMCCRCGSEVVPLVPSRRHTGKWVCVNTAACRRRVHRKDIKKRRQR